MTRRSKYLLINGKKKNKSDGFLLIEIIVALFIFSMVATVSIGSIITIFDANKKAQSLQVVMDNLNLAMDSMTRAITTGHNLTCAGAVRGSGADCDDTNAPGNEVSFISQNDELVTFAFKSGSDCPGSGPNDAGCIVREIENGQPVRLTSSEIAINSITFNVVGTDSFVLGDNKQPKVLIFIDGTAKAGPRNDTNFSFQTAISQRKPDL